MVLNMKKKILFLSGIDFKKKSIQIISKTPEAYCKSGWDVYYIVARDNSRYSNYFYEDILNPEGVNIERFNYPLTILRDSIYFHFFRTILSKISSYIVIFKLFFRGLRIVKKINIDVIYGYEIQGVLAGQLLRFFLFFKYYKLFPFVTRFQGTILKDLFDQKKYIKILLNIDHFLALYLPSSLCIMTDDGTKGDELLNKIYSFNCSNYRFWINGVDSLYVDDASIREFKDTIEITDGQFILLSVSRLERWKRVDRIIRVADILVNKYCFYNFRLFVVGGGNEKSILSNLIFEYNLNEFVFLTGPINYECVKYYYHIADIFISTNDISNVGNPLLEAIRTNKIIFTLNTGNTSRWISHGINGFIYDIQDNFLERMAMDIVKCLTDPVIRQNVIRNVRITEREKLWTWEERMNAEICEVNKLIKNI